MVSGFGKSNVLLSWNQGGALVMEKANLFSKV
jgi:hypothetical protein